MKQIIAILIVLSAPLYAQNWSSVLSQYQTAQIELLPSADSTRVKKMEKNPCEQNKAMEKMKFRFKIKTAQETLLEVVLKYSGDCTIAEDDGEGAVLDAPVAYRSFKGDNAGYGFYIYQELNSATSEIMLSQSLQEGGYLIAGQLPAQKTSKLLKKGILDLGPIEISDYRERFKRIKGSATLEVLENKDK